ncbi:MAG: lipopolysaccharide biosynthesis protein [Kofleriaceae bacterium]
MESNVESGQADVGHKTRRGISWNLAGALGTNAMRVVVIAVLGRALSSRDFGIVAAAITVNMVLYSIRDIGIGPALVQRKDLQRGHLTTTFAVSTYLGIGISTLLVLGAPLIGRLYGITESVDVIRALSALFVLRGIAMTSRIMCQREMNFRVIAVVDASTFAIGSVTSMVCAVAGLGPWALVAGYLVEEALGTIMYLWTSPPPFSLKVDRARFRELMSFGAGQTVSQIVGILATYGDNFVVGSALGARALGNYTRAYDLIKFPSAVFASIVGNVLFPAFSRLQDDVPRLATQFRRVLFLNGLVLLPASAALAVLAPETIRILVGEGWDDAVLPFRILAVTILFRTSQKLGAIVAQAAGRANAVAVAYVVYMVLVIGGAMISIQWGIVGVAVSTAIAIIVVCCESCFLGMQVSRLPLRSVLVAHVPGLILASLVVAVTLPLAEVLRATELASWAVFMIAVVAAGLVCLAAILAWMARGRGEFAWLADELKRLIKRRSKAAVIGASP